MCSAIAAFGGCSKAEKVEGDMTYPTTSRRGRIIFTGNFWEYFFLSLLLLALSVLTLGLLLPYWAYWSLKYFFTQLEIEIEVP